ncbi:hypothetical protein BCR44DRAFT_42965 [Catenaria anguillulae PL171]|uniref:Uncharacterized protein n=1 Tax=Catenaria anguillulae PL171 TaxID=765915 RepID=A0A1Y2HGN4_9FUNG|nr:hypothetical protein BCR44DRAFT_42965 [Catenaria anguillulae PL171]
MPVPDLAITTAIVSDLVRQLCGISKENEAHIHALKSDLASLRAVIAPVVAATPLPPPPAVSGTPAGADQLSPIATLPPIPSDLTATASASTILQDETHTNATTTAASSVSPSAVGSPTVLLRDGPLSVDVAAPLPDLPVPNKASAEASTETSTADFVASTAVQTSPKDDRASNSDSTPLLHSLPTMPIAPAPPSTASTGSQSDASSSAVSSGAADVKESAVQTRNMPDPQIAALKKDNAALMSTLKEYESTLELIMTKFRSYALSTQNEKKLLSQDHAKQLDQERLQAQSYALTNVQLAQQLERAHAAIRASLQASAEDDELVLQELAATQAEAKTLREVVAVHEETKEFYKQVDRFLADKAAAKPKEETPPASGATELVSPKDDQPLESSTLPNPHSPPTHPLGGAVDVASTPLASAAPAPEIPSSPPSANAAVFVDADPTPVLSPRDLVASEPQAHSSGVSTDSKPLESVPAPTQPLQANAVAPPPPAPAASVASPPVAANPLIGAGTAGSSLSMSRSISNPFLQSTLAAPGSGTPPLGINPLLGPMAAPTFANTSTTETNPATVSADQAAADWGDWSDDLGVPLDTGAPTASGESKKGM